MILFDRFEHGIFVRKQLAQISNSLLLLFDVPKKSHVSVILLALQVPFQSLDLLLVIGQILLGVVPDYLQSPSFAIVRGPAELP